MATSASKRVGKTLLSWEISEYPDHERSAAWYVGAVVVGLGLIAYALITLNFLFAFVVLMSGIILLVSASRMPNQIAVAIAEDGIAIGRRFMPWKELEKFSVIYEPPAIKSLYLDFKSSWRPHLTIPLEHQNPVALRKTLLAYLPEDLAREDEPLSDLVGRVLKI